MVEVDGCVKASCVTLPAIFRQYLLATSLSQIIAILIFPPFSHISLSPYYRHKLLRLSNGQTMDPSPTQSEKNAGLFGLATMALPPQ
jgi:hypothetical protein